MEHPFSRMIGNNHPPMTLYDIKKLIDLQTAVFNPIPDKEDILSKAQFILAGQSQAHIMIVRSMLKRIKQLRPATKSLFDELSKQLTDDGFFGYEKRMPTTIRGILDTFSPRVHIEETEEVIKLRQILEKDDVEGFRTFIEENQEWTNTPVYSIGREHVFGVNACFLTRAFKCIDFILKEQSQIMPENGNIAILSLTKDEFLRYFSVPDDTNDIFFENAARSRALWALEKLQKNVNYWRFINEHGVLVEAEPEEPWYPVEFGHKVRTAYELVLDSKEWNRLSDVSDRIFAGEEVDIDDPFIQFIEADAAVKRIHDFDMHVERMIKHLTDIPELVRWRKLPMFFAFTKGVPFYQGNDKFFDPFIEGSETYGDEEAIRTMHPSYIPSLDYCLYNDDVGYLVNCLDSIDPTAINAASKRLIGGYDVGSLFQNGDVLCFAALYGSSNCFRYLLENGYRVNFSVATYAFLGGNMAVEGMVIPLLNGTLIDVCSLLNYRRLPEIEWCIENKVNIFTSQIGVLFPTLEYTKRFSRRINFSIVYTLPKSYWRYFMEIFIPRELVMRF